MSKSLNDVKKVLADSLQLGERARGFTAATPLLGSVPELDSMAVIGVIEALERHFGFTVHDDEISADTFATLGSLCVFVDQKLTT
jgi:acyl carrier protein